MKVWIKYLLGVAFGVLAAFILPTENAAFANAIAFLTELFIRVGRYIVVPLIFTSTIVAVSKLRTSRLLWKTSGLTVLIIVLSSLMMTLIGLISILLVKLPRIPITVDVATEAFNLDVKGMILSLFPYSGFEALRDGSFLLVCFVFAFIIGWESASEETAFKPVFVLSDSFSNLFYNVANFFTEIMSVLGIAIVCYWVMDFRSVIATGIFTPMIIMFLVDFVIIAGIIYPLILRFVCHDPHPYKVLYASIAPLILAFFGGDSNLVIPLANRHLCDSLGIRRRCRSFTYPLFTIFARGGSALVTTVSFILIWRSYSSLSISISDVMWIFGLSFGLSFLLGGIPSGAAFVLLTIICNKYARGFETSVQLLKPATMIICSFAALYDTLTAMFGSYIVAVKTKMIEHHSITHFI